MNDKKTHTTIWVIALAFMSNSVVTKPMATMSDSLGSIWVMDVFLIYKWWCVWHPPEVWVNPSGPYKWSLNADYQSERWLWFLASMSVGSYLGIKLNDDCHWHLTECCFLDMCLSGHSVIAIQMSDDYKPGYIWLMTECLTSIWVWLVSSISERCVTEG